MNDLQRNQLCTILTCHPGIRTPQASQVILAIPEGLKIREVLYGWKAYSDGNLINKAGLPASTFKVKISD